LVPSGNFSPLFRWKWGHAGRQASNRLLGSVFLRENTRHLSGDFADINAVGCAFGAFVGFGLELLGSKTCPREAGEE